MEVPTEVAQFKQWMLWRLEYGTKVPYQTDGTRAKSNDARTWAELNEVKEQSSSFDGIAFVFSENDPFCGVDLDDCLENGKYLPWAQEILDRFKGCCYCEISPSGTGVKLTTRAKKPEGSRCKNGGVECYDNKRFWTWTGQCLGEGFDAIGEGQEAVEWLIEKHLKGEPRQTGTKRLAASAGGSFELLARAEAYVDKCEPAAKGNRDNSAFSISGHLHSLVGEHGERLSDTDVYNLLRSWNLRNPEPLTDEEIKSKAINGRKNGTPPADKQPEPKLTEAPDVDLSGILQTAIEGAPADVPFSPGDFPRDAIPTDGIIGQTIAYNLATAMYPQPELALAGALALMGVITGRKIETEYGTRTNVYILGLGESGTGKEYARKVNKRILYAVGSGEAIKMLGPERIGSHAGLTVHVKERLSVLFQIDEIGHLLATMKNPGRAAHLYNIAAVLMQMYSSSDSVWVGDAYAKTEQTPEIDQPHPVLYGTCTPDSFWNSLTEDNVANGLLGRMMVFEAPDYADKQIPRALDVPSQLRDAVSDWVEHKPAGVDKSMWIADKAEHTPEALARLNEHLDGIAEQRRNEPRDQAAIWSRTGEKTAKISLLFACSRCSPEKVQINLVDMDRAVKISNWLTRRMLKQAYDYVAANYVEDNSKKLLRAINKEMSIRDLSNKTRWLKKKERYEILSDLVEMGLVEMREEQTGGRPRTLVRRI